MASFAVKESTESIEFKKYIGIAPVTILAVNPNKAELEKIYSSTLDKDPEYISDFNVGTEELPKLVKQVRIDFILKTDEEKCGINMISKASFYIANSPRYNKDKSKIQVINKYGETAYITPEEFKTKQLADNMKWFDTSDIRPSFIGEEDLVNALKAYLCVSNKSFKTPSGEFKTIDNLSDAEAKLDKIPDYFKGDIRELSNLVKMLPNNKVKVLFGVKTTDTNKQYQDIFKELWVKNNITNYTYLEKKMNEKKDNGAYGKTEFRITPLQEYSVEATNFASSSIDSTNSRTPVTEEFNPESFFQPEV